MGSTCSPCRATHASGRSRFPGSTTAKSARSGRSTSYNSKSKRGTEVAAIFYSLVETATLVGVDPKRYLKVALAAALKGDRIPLPFELSPEV